MEITFYIVFGFVMLTSFAVRMEGEKLRCFMGSSPGHLHLQDCDGSCYDVIRLDGNFTNEKLHGCLDRRVPSDCKVVEGWLYCFCNYQICNP